jgi:hypothetical protein
MKELKFKAIFMKDENGWCFDIPGVCLNTQRTTQPVAVFNAKEAMQHRIKEAEKQGNPIQQITTEGALSFQIKRRVDDYLTSFQEIQIMDIVLPQEESDPCIDCHVTEESDCVACIKDMQDEHSNGPGPVCRHCGEIHEHPRVRLTKYLCWFDTAIGQGGNPDSVCALMADQAAGIFCERVSTLLVDRQLPPLHSPVSVRVMEVGHKHSRVFRVTSSETVEYTVTETTEDAHDET